MSYNIEVLFDWLSFHKEGEDIQFNQLNEGQTPIDWEHLIKLPYLIPPEIRGRITKVYIKNGLLTFEGITLNHETQLLVDILYTGIATRSSKICMMCGAKGERRKLEDGKPVLCTADYIRYLNYLADNNLYTRI
jgi:hypothetical protein